MNKNIPAQPPIWVQQGSFGDFELCCPNCGKSICVAWNQLDWKYYFCECGQVVDMKPEEKMSYEEFISR